MLQPCSRWLAAAIFPLLSGLALANDPDKSPGVAESAFSGQDLVLDLNMSNRGYPPYLIINDDGGYSGIAYDVVTRIADRIGYDVEFHQIPRKRVDNMLLEGHIDATPRAREWTEDPDQFLFTDAMVPVREVFFSKADSDFRFDGLDSLKGITLVTPLGYHYPDLEPLFEEGTVERYEVSEDRDIFTYLLHGRSLDATVADLTVGQWIIRQHGWQGKFRHSSQTLTDYGYRLMLRPGWQSFAEAFNKELTKMKDSGELDQILDQYR